MGKTLVANEFKFLIILGCNKSKIMSLAINWALLDDELARGLESYLNDRVSSIESPHFRNAKVIGLAWGDAAPDVTILDITDPFDEFYLQEDPLSAVPKPAAPYSAEAPLSSMNRVPPPLARSPNDVQLHVHVAFQGTLSLEMQVELGAPLPGGGGGSIWLPVNLRLRGFHIDALVIAAWINNDRVSWCFLEVEDDVGRSNNILKALHIETSVGDSKKQVLHNVSKVERFLVDEIHRLLESECVWPNYQTVMIER